MLSKFNNFNHLLVFLFSAATMLLEILLVKTCNVIIYSTAGFFLLTMALFFLSLSGAALHYFINIKNYNPNKIFTFSALGFCLLASLSLPLLRLSPFLFEFKIESSFIATLAVVLLISLPFLFSGICILLLLTECDSKNFQILYFFDLLGVVAVVAIPRLLISFFGPDGLMAVTLIIFITALFIFGLKSVSFFGNIFLTAILALNIFLIVTLKPNSFLRPYVFKYMPQNVPLYQVEVSAWDPIARIDVVDFSKTFPENGIFRNSTETKYMFYDGGTIGTNIYPYDGNAKKLLNTFRSQPTQHFLRLSTVTSHLLKQNSNYSAFLFGVGAGQEVKAALTFGAKKIYANELVQTVIDLNKNDYAFYNGNIFNSEKVKILVGDGRIQLNRLKEKFDIIQIFSNYLSNNMAAGLSAFQVTYLFTKESLREYMNHLNENGILQINQFKHERVLDLLAQAWVDDGHDLQDLKKHIFVINNQNVNDIFTTILFKKSLFLLSEEQVIKDLFKIDSNSQYQILESPFVIQPTYLTSLQKPQELERHYVATDRRPYFSSDDSLALHFYGLNKLAYFSLLTGSLFLATFFTLRYSLKIPNQSLISNGLNYFLSGIAFIFLQVSLLQMVLKYLNWPDMAFPLVIGGLCSGIAMFNLFLHKFMRQIQKLHIQLGLVLFLILIPFLPGLFENISHLSNAVACLIFFIIFSILGLLGCNVFSFAIFLQGRQSETKFLYQAWLFQGLGVLLGSMIMHILFIRWGLQVVLALALLCSSIFVYLIKTIDAPNKG